MKIGYKKSSRKSIRNERMLSRLIYIDATETEIRFMSLILSSLATMAVTAASIF